MAIDGKKLSELVKIEDISISEEQSQKYVPLLDLTKVNPAEQNKIVDIYRLLTSLINDTSQIDYNKVWSAAKLYNEFQQKASVSYVDGVNNSLLNLINLRATKEYVDNLLLGLSWQNPVIDFVTQTQLNGLSPQNGDRYIVTDNTNINKIAEYDSGWQYITPQNNWAVVRSSGSSIPTIYVYNSNLIDNFKWISLQGISQAPYDPYKYFVLSENMSKGDLVVLQTNGKVKKVSYNPIIDFGTVHPSTSQKSWYPSVTSIDDSTFVSSYTYQSTNTESNTINRVQLMGFIVSGTTVSKSSAPYVLTDYTLYGTPISRLCKATASKVAVCYGMNIKDPSDFHLFISTLNVSGTTLTPLGNVELPVATANLNTARSSLAGAGTSNSALGFGGYNGSYLATTELFDGTSWTTKSNMNVARGYLAGTGTSNSALSFGGFNNNSRYLATTELFDGTSWTTKSNMNVARQSLAGVGTSNSALSFGGYNGYISYNGGYLATTELFDGISWTTKSNMNTTQMGLAGAGTSNSALSFGGYDRYNGGNLATTELFDGISWTTKSNMNVARRYLAGTGTSNSALGFGGYNGSYLATTELFDGTSWTTKSDMNVARYGLAGAGTSNSALSFGGYNGSYLATTELFDGTSWSSLRSSSSVEWFYLKPVNLGNDKIILFIGDCFYVVDTSTFSYIRLSSPYPYVRTNNYFFSSSYAPILLEVMTSSLIVTYVKGNKIALYHYDGSVITSSYLSSSAFTTNDLNHFVIRKINDTHFLLVYTLETVPNTVEVKIGKINDSGDNVTFYGPFSTSLISFASATVISESAFVIFHSGGILKGNIDITQLSITFDLNIDYSFNSTYNDSEKIGTTESVVNVYNPTNTSGAKITKGIIYISTTQEKILGIVQADGNAEESKPVAIFGDISKVHTGLTPGNLYYYNVDTGNGVTSQQTTQLAGIALSPTEIKITTY